MFQNSRNYEIDAKRSEWAFILLILWSSAYMAEKYDIGGRLLQFENLCIIVLHDVKHKTKVYSENNIKHLFGKNWVLNAIYLWNISLYSRTPTLFYFYEFMNLWAQVFKYKKNLRSSSMWEVNWMAYLWLLLLFFEPLFRLVILYHKNSLVLAVPLLI